MTTLPEIAAEARRMAAEYRSKSARQTWQRGTGQSLCFAAARDFDRLAEMAEPKTTATALTVPVIGERPGDTQVWGSKP